MPSRLNNDTPYVAISVRKLRKQSKAEVCGGVGCGSPQPSFDSNINELARLWRAFSLCTKLSKGIQKEIVISQTVREIPRSITNRFQKLHGTKLAQSGTKSRGEFTH
jgi:hypothetical protein